MIRTLRSLAGIASSSICLRKAKKLWEANQNSYELPLSLLDKGMITAYIVLKNYSDGNFPPTFEDQQLAYRREIEYRHNFAGVDSDHVVDVHMRKPFWPGKVGRDYLADYLFLVASLERFGISQGAHLLELGCGQGWMAEFLATNGYKVTASTLAEDDVADCQRRVQSLAAKGLDVELTFLCSPMESIAEKLDPEQPLDAVFVYEALHHAFSWRDTLKSVSGCLKPGGLLLICNEPNLFHTVRAYRGALLTNTHEIGFRKSQLKNSLHELGFEKYRVIRGRLGFYVRPFWIAVRKKM